MTGGWGVVIFDKSNYDQLVLGLLQDGNTYLKLPGDPTNRYKEDLEQLLTKGKAQKIINEQEFNYLNIKYPRIPVIYVLPKIQKDPVNPPGRPIVSGINSITSRLSAYIDFFLQKYVVKMKSYLKDSHSVLDFLKMVKVEKDLILCTSDVSLLYTCIPHEAGVNAIRESLNSDHTMHFEQKEFIIDCIQFCLTKNYFWFQKKFYNQQSGTAMGTKFAPIFANLYMQSWEDKYIYCDNNPFRQIVTIFKRYIDDCIIL